MKIVRLNARETVLRGNYGNRECLILCDATLASFSVTLPSAVSVQDQVFYFKKTDSSVNAVTILPSNSQTIDGAESCILPIQYSKTVLVPDSDNWLQFDSIAPVGGTGYTVSGHATDRTLNAAVSTLNETINVLCTLIADLQTAKILA